MPWRPSEWRPKQPGVLAAAAHAVVGAPEAVCKRRQPKPKLPGPKLQRVRQEFQRRRYSFAKKMVNILLVLYSSYKHISVIKIADFSWSNKGNHFVKKVNNSYIARTVWCRSNFERAGVLWRRAGFLLGARFLRRALFWGLTSLARRFIKIGYDRRHRDVGTGVVSRTDSDRKTGKVGPLNDDLFLKICILM